MGGVMEMGKTYSGEYVVKTFFAVLTIVSLSLL